MERPKSLSIKDFIVRKMSIKILLPEFTIDAVISHQLQSATQAMSNTKSIEISGFGRFIFNEKKALRKMEKLLSQKKMFEGLMINPDISVQRQNNARLKYETALLEISILKPKLKVQDEHTIEPDLSGVEK